MLYDTVIADGQVFTDGALRPLHIGIQAGAIAALSAEPLQGREVIDATGRMVLPGGIDAHCHIDQRTSTGVSTADGFYDATVGAAFGGTTTVMPFAAQRKGQSLRQAVNDYMARAQGEAVVDYAFHMILTDPRDEILQTELPALVGQGFTSIKIYTTYDALKISEQATLDVLLAARRLGVITMVHAESHEVIGWLTAKLLKAGMRAIPNVAKARPQLSESIATYQAIGFAQLLDTPIYIVHVSSQEAIHQIQIAQTLGLDIFAETCPQYLLLTADDLNRPPQEAAKFCCSPPPRDHASQEALWRAMAAGHVTCFSSDHSAFKLADDGKFTNGADPAFNEVPFGMPGLETRLPILFSEGYLKGRITLQRFVELTASEPARLFGLDHRKGTIRVGLDADLVLWDRTQTLRIASDTLHDGLDYSAFEGLELRGVPVLTMCRGQIICADGQLRVSKPQGQLLACQTIGVVTNKPPLEDWLQ